MKQNRITEKINLLDANGNVVLPGWSEQNRYIYSRKAIKGNRTRIKEWDFYQITSPRFTCQLTAGDISLGGAASFCIFDRETGKRYESMILSLLTFGSFGMPSSATEPHVITRRGTSGTMQIVVTEKTRYITYSSTEKNLKIKADIELKIPEGLESLTMAVPFKEKGHFYLNQKINCMPALGRVIAGDKVFEFSPGDSFGLLDWGRGVWPYRSSWYWGNGSCCLPDGSLFGFEIGWGFGIMEDFTENCLFYNGKAHKIGRVFLENNKKDLMSPWYFTSDDGRFNMTMVPQYDNFTSSRVLGIAGNICHQVFGLFSGTAVLDDGTVLNIKDMTAFCEHSDNRW